MSKTKIYAAKININENIFCPNYKDIIPLIGDAVLKTNIVMLDKNEKYDETNSKYNITAERFHFQKTEKVIINNYEYIFGYLYLSRDSHREKNTNEDGTSIKKEINNVYKSMFLLDVTNEIIVFESIKNLNYKKFMNKFAKLCTFINNNIGDIVLTLYPMKHEIEKIIESMDKIFFAEFKVIPANFNAREGFLALDKVMKRDGIDEIEHSMKSKNGTISASKGSVFSYFMDMVKKPYGQCKVKYKKKNSKDLTTFDSKDKSYQIEFDKNKIKNEEEEKKELSKFIEKIKEENDL